MKKLKLSLDDLKVESFPTTAEGRGGEGTVFGLAVDTKFPNPCQWTEGGTCLYTCAETCPVSCFPDCSNVECTQVGYPC